MSGRDDQISKLLEKWPIGSAIAQSNPVAIKTVRDRPVRESCFQPSTDRKEDLPDITCAFVPLRSVSLKSASLRFAPLKSAPLRFALPKVAPLRSASLRFALLKSTFFMGASVSVEPWFLRRFIQSFRPFISEKGS